MYSSDAQAAREIASDSVSLLDAAYGCRAGGLSMVTCAPILLAQFPSTLANDMCAALSLAWAGIANNDNMSQALTACGYSQTDITTAITAVLHLAWQTNATYTNSPVYPSMQKVHALYQGDLTNLSVGELVDFLVVSALPGDYAPTPGTLIGSLANIGVSVQQLSQNPAASYPNFNCWVSQPIANQKFGALIVFESTGAQAPQNIPGILNTLQAFWPNPHQGSNYPFATIAQPLVSTGSAGGDPNAVLTALFNSAKSVLSSPYALGCVMTDVYTQSEVAPMVALFNSLKG